MEDVTSREDEQLTVLKKVKEVNSFGITFDSLDEIMKSFSYMDNRSCTCMEVLNYVFWQISQHIFPISNSGFNFLMTIRFFDNCNNYIHIKRSYFSEDIQQEMFIKFTMQYSAGLIETGQCLYAIKFLMNINDYFNEKEKEKEKKKENDQYISFKEQWLILIGKFSPHI